MPAGRICAPRSIMSICNIMRGDTMESGHNKISEPHHLGLLKMLSASVRDGHTRASVETRAGHENRGRGRILQLLQFCLKSCPKESSPLSQRSIHQICSQELQHQKKAHASTYTFSDSHDSITVKTEYPSPAPQVPQESSAPSHSTPSLQSSTVSMHCFHPPGKICSIQTDLR